MTKFDLSRHRIFNDPALKQIWCVLDGARPSGTRLVGGCVRDALLGKPVSDIDLATQLTPDDVTRLCEAADFDVIPTGIAHGTITVLAQGKPFEVTTLRKDVSTDGRRATVAYTDDWHEDALRRDFTMNALYCDRDGIIHDPTGQGTEDALAGNLRFVGDPDARILEDHLRILRYFRFAARFQKNNFSGPDFEACARYASLIKALSVERVWMELKKILGSEDPRAALKAMAASGVLSVVLPEAKGLATFNALVELETAAFLESHPLQRLMALLPRNVETVGHVATRLKLSWREAERLQAWAKDDTKLVSYLSAREVRQALYWMGNQAYLDRVRLAWAEDPDPRRTTQWRTLLAFEGGFVAPQFPVTGNQAIAAGARPGPAVGEVLREVERWWVENDFVDDELSLIERLKAVVQALG
jgi:poly(A) polymerase